MDIDVSRIVLECRETGSVGEDIGAAGSGHFENPGAVGDLCAGIDSHLQISRQGKGAHRRDRELTSLVGNRRHGDIAAYNAGKALEGGLDPARAGIVRKRDIITSVGEDIGAAGSGHFENPGAGRECCQGMLGHAQIDTLAHGLVPLLIEGETPRAEHEAVEVQSQGAADR